MDKVLAHTQGGRNLPLPIDFIERLKAANPIAEVMSSYVTLKEQAEIMFASALFTTKKPRPAIFILTKSIFTALAAEQAEMLSLLQ